MKKLPVTQGKKVEKNKVTNQRRKRVRLHDKENSSPRYRVRLDECVDVGLKKSKGIKLGRTFTAEQLQQASMFPEQTYLNTEQAAWYLRLSPKTLQNWRVSGKGPKCETFGSRARRYLFAELQRWAANSKKAPQ